MNITDAEIVTLHILLLWSSNNNRHVNEQTKQLMKKRREWAVDRLYEHYEQVGTTDPMVRLGEVLLLLPEIELVCDQHCKDFQVAQLFDFCNMSELWYERICYTNLSTQF
uniref:NR LBD domain-containing protein n=1 Tax=Ditylenchus dipsaci TaxID=166011 RepID=A0A915EGV0_9BILA